MMLAYFDCFSGISGDMTLGALIDLGVPFEWFKQNIYDLPLNDFNVEMTSISKKGLQATDILITAHTHTHSRNYSYIKNLIETSYLSDKVKTLSLEIFEKIANAESIVHNTPIDKIHFHEIGGIDSIVDIVGTALCIEYLGIQKVISSKLPLGSGFVECSHGRIPVPAPATVKILKNVPVYGSDIQNELVTPTGAAIITTIADSFGPLPEMNIKKIGYGAGKNDIDTQANLLRIITGTVCTQSLYTKDDDICIVETCIDDMNPEIFSFLMDRLFDDGALDVYFIPVFMKKNRPGTKLEVLCKQDIKDTVIKRILSETTSLGVRYYDVKRKILARETLNLNTSYGTVTAKKITDTGGNIRIVPEYEACKKIAIEKDMPIKFVYDAIVKEKNNLK